MIELDLYNFILTYILATTLCFWYFDWVIISTNARLQQQSIQSFQLLFNF